MPWRLNPFTGELYLDEVGSSGSGGGGSTGPAVYVHTQSTASDTWTINHSIGDRPSTELFNSSNEEIDGSIEHPSSGVTIVNFEISVAGYARLTGDPPPTSLNQSYVHTQSTPSSTWTINHNLGFIPSVELFNSGSQEIDGQVTHTSNNQTVVTFETTVAGTARLN